MSVTYAIHLPLRALPDSGWLAASVRGMAPTFAWVADYDLAHDTGWCPCQLDGAECGFDWDLDREPTLSPTDARRYDVTAQVSHGASELDARCAILVAAHVAQIAGGVLLTPGGDSIDGDAALAWASAALRKARKPARKRMPAKPPIASEAQVATWLGALAGASIEHIMRSLPDDPLTGLRFSTGLILKAPRWSVTTPQARHATADLSVALEARIAALEAAEHAAIALLRSGLLLQARWNASQCAIELQFAGGTWTAEAATDNEAWSLSDGTRRIEPDLTQGGWREGA